MFNTVSHFFSPFLIVSQCFSPFLIFSHHFSLFLTVSHCFSLFLTVSYRFSLFLTVSYCFSPLLTVSPCFSPFLIVSHRLSLFLTVSQCSHTLNHPTFSCISYMNRITVSLCIDLRILGKSGVPRISRDSTTGSDMPSALGLVMMIITLLAWHKEGPQKQKTGLCGENSQTGMSTIPSFFGMPKSF